MVEMHGKAFLQELTRGKFVNEEIQNHLHSNPSRSNLLACQYTFILNKMKYYYIHPSCPIGSMLVSFVLAAAGKEQLVGTAAATNHSTASPTVMRLFNAQKPRVSAAFPDLIRLHWIVSLDQEGEQRFWKSEHVIHHSIQS